MIDTPWHEYMIQTLAVEGFQTLPVGGARVLGEMDAIEMAIELIEEVVPSSRQSFFIGVDASIFLPGMDESI